MAVNWGLYWTRAKQFKSWLGPFLTWALPRLAVIAPSIAAMIGVHNLLVTTGSSPTAAVVGAISFELAYITLALVAFETAEELQTARWIRWGAVSTSILFNVTDQFFKLRPWWIHASAAKGAEVHTVGLDIYLSLLHGLPLPLLGFLLSALILHPPRGLSRDELRAQLATAKEIFEELQARFDTLQAQFVTSQRFAQQLLPYRDRVAELEQVLAAKEAPVQVVEKTVTAKAWLGKLKQSGLTFPQIAAEALKVHGEVEAANILGITKAQLRSLAKGPQ